MRAFRSYKREIVQDKQEDKRDILDIRPNKLLQQTGHATDGISCFNGSSRVSRLLSDFV